MPRWRTAIDEHLLRRLYIEDRLSTTALAKRFCCTHRTVCKRLDSLGIPRLPKRTRAREPKSAEERRRMSQCCRRGPAHPRWKGGRVEANKRVRDSVEYQLWREAVFARDDWTCVCCHHRGGDLQADHIKAFAFYPELRTDVANGRTLCESCHDEATAEQRRASGNWTYCPFDRDWLAD